MRKSYEHHDLCWYFLPHSSSFAVSVCVFVLFILFLVSQTTFDRGRSPIHQTYCMWRFCFLVNVYIILMMMPADAVRVYVSNDSLKVLFIDHNFGFMNYNDIITTKYVMSQDVRAVCCKWFESLFVTFNKCLNIWCFELKRTNGCC